MRKEILVIDDSKALRFMLHTILKKHYKVVSVADGVSAMFYLRNNRQPDLIIADPDLPDYPAWELIKYLTTSHLYESIPVIALTGEDYESAREQAVQCNLADFFVKPFNPLNLLESVDHILADQPVQKIY